MADGRSGLTPGAEVNTIPSGFEPGLSVQAYYQGNRTDGTASRGTGRAARADLNRTILEES